MSDDIQSSNGNRKVTWIMGHIQGEQEKMPEGEERNEAEENPCSQASGPCRAGAQQLPQGTVQEDKNQQPAGDWETRLGLSRGDEN